MCVGNRINVIYKKSDMRHFYKFTLLHLPQIKYANFLINFNLTSVFFSCVSCLRDKFLLPQFLIWFWEFAEQSEWLTSVPEEGHWCVKHLINKELQVTK